MDRVKEKLGASDSIAQKATKAMEIWQILLEKGNAAEANKADVEAEQLYLQAITECQNASHRRPDSLALCLLHLGHLYEGQAKYENAEEVFELVLNIFESIHGPRSGAVALMLDRMSSVCRAQGKHMEARALSIRACSLCTTASTSRRKPAMTSVC